MISPPSFDRIAGSRLGVLAVLAICSAVMLLPTILLGAGNSISDIYNYVWTQQFSSQLLQGDPYPRWLYGSTYGLGSPAFYYYPPLSFFVAAAINALAVGTLPTTYQIGLATLVLLFASGVTMFAWLRRSVPAAWALAGAVAYQAAPSHLVGHYVRGAFAEFGAFIFIPLVALALHRLTRPRPLDVLLLPLAYAGLVLAHTPVALLASSTIIPFYILYLTVFHLKGARSRLVYLCRAAALGLLGVALAAFYLGPMIALQPFIDSARVWGPSMQPKPWLLINFRDWPYHYLAFHLALLAAASAVFCAGVLWASLRARPWQMEGAAESPVREASFWAAVGLICFAIMGGVVPLYWDVSILAKVQFPYRIMVCLEFATVTAVILLLSRRGLRPMWIAGVLALCLLGWGLGKFGLETAAGLPRQISPAGAEQRQVWGTTLQDLEEFYPKGFFPKTDRYDEDRDPSDARFTASGKARVAALSTQPDITVVGSGSASATVQADGSLDVVVTAQSPVRVVLRRFYFPSWIVRSDAGRRMQVEPYGADQLVSFEAPPGTTRYTAAIHRLEVEIWSGLVSGVALLLSILAYAALFVRSSRRSEIPEAI